MSRADISGYLSKLSEAKSRLKRGPSSVRLFFSVAEIYIACFATMDQRYHFQWDWANLRHIVEENEMRGIKAEEIESVFSDPFKRIQPSQFDELREEQRFKLVGLSHKNRMLIVIFVVTPDNLIRPITSYICKNKSVLEAYENAKKQQTF